MTLDTLGRFSTDYINTLSKSYHFGFGVACLSLIVSMIIFWAFRKHYKVAAMTERQKARSETLKSQVVELTREQTRERLVGLGLVFFVVIFFWMAFHQSAVTMTYFARDYTVPSVGKATNLWFDLTGLLPVFLSVLGLVFLARKASGKLARILGGVSFIGFGVLAYLRYSGYGTVNPFQPQMFQHFNPFFIVVLTPIVVGIFGWLNKKGKEPSAPRKIGIGMLMTAAAYVILVVGSIGLPQPEGPRRPGRPGRLPGLRLLAHLDLFHADDRRALPQPDRHLLRLQGRPAQVQGADAGRLVRRHGHRQLPRRGHRLVLGCACRSGRCGPSWSAPACSPPPSSSPS